MYSTTDQMIVNALQYINRNKALIAMDIDPAQVDAVSYQPVMVNEIILGKDASSSFLLSYILMFAVYMLVIMYGAFVSTSVAREKDNRTMEILITSTSPQALIIGKVFANALGGLIQFGIIITVGLIGYFFNQQNYPTEIIQMVFAGFSFDSRRCRLINYPNYNVIYDRLLYFRLCYQYAKWIDHYDWFLCTIYCHLSHANQIFLNLSSIN